MNELPRPAPKRLPGFKRIDILRPAHDRDHVWCSWDAESPNSIGNEEGRTQLRRPIPQPPPRLYAVVALRYATGQLPGKAKGCSDREPGDRPDRRLNPNPVGCDGRRNIMFATTLSTASVQHAGLVRPILTSAVLGTFLIFAAGFASSDALHAATHDTRHATGFPCH